PIHTRGLIRDALGYRQLERIARHHWRGRRRQVLRLLEQHRRANDGRQPDDDAHAVPPERQRDRRIHSGGRRSRFHHYRWDRRVQQRRHQLWTERLHDHGHHEPGVLLPQWEDATTQRRGDDDQRRRRVEPAATHPPVYLAAHRLSA